MHHRQVVYLLLGRHDMFSRSSCRGHLIFHSPYNGCSQGRTPAPPFCVRGQLIGDEQTLSVAQHKIWFTLSAARSTASRLNRPICNCLVMECSTDGTSEPEIFILVNVYLWLTYNYRPENVLFVPVCRIMYHHSLNAKYHAMFRYN